MKYYELQIKPLDEQYLDELSKAYGIARDELEVEDSLLISDPTNAIMRELLAQIATQEVEDEGDCEKIINRIYCNCLDSGYDIDPEELETQQAKEFIENF